MSATCEITWEYWDRRRGRWVRPVCSCGYYNDKVMWDDVVDDGPAEWQVHDTERHLGIRPQPERRIYARIRI